MKLAKKLANRGRDPPSWGTRASKYELHVTLAKSGKYLHLHLSRFAEDCRNDCRIKRNRNFRSLLVEKPTHCNSFDVLEELASLEVPTGIDTRNERFAERP